MGEGAGGTACPECGVEVRPGQLLCQGCFVPFSLMPGSSVLPGTSRMHGTPASGTPRDRPPAAPEAAVLLPHRRSAADAEPEHTRVLNAIRGGLPRPAEDHQEAPSRALHLRFPGGETVPVEPGHMIRLGRDPRRCPAVPFLAAHDNLSRIHATIGVEADGSAWVADESSTNGTFAHGYRLAPGERSPLRPGDSIRLAADVTVRLLP
ncbi:FHA domain-containing protein [Actinacidiphila alni]|uniref:FHA domain-containing protein n=1 Tax=Actinacidiphila alni TaxID=380248 RepID=UPI003451DB9F